MGRPACGRQDCSSIRFYLHPLNLHPTLGQSWTLKIDLKTSVVYITKGYSNVNSPDMVWWEKAKLPNVEYIDVSELNIGPPSET